MPKAQTIAAAIEEKTDEMALTGWELVTFSVTPSAKAILVFRKPENIKAYPRSAETSASRIRFLFCLDRKHRLLQV